MTPLVRIPPNGGEMNQWIAKQVLDSGVYGIVWPHVSTVEEARNAVAACRYPRPKDAPRYEPAGQRGDAPTAAARYWGLTQQEYYARADVWPLAPDGEILVAIMCEEARAIEEPAEHPGAGAGHRRGDDRRGRPLAGSGLPAPVRAPDGGLGDRARSWRSASSTTCRAVTRTWIGRTWSG